MNTRYLITKQNLDADDLLNIAACAIAGVRAAHPNPIRLQEKDGCRRERGKNRNADSIRSIMRHAPYMCYIMSVLIGKLMRLRRKRFGLVLTTGRPKIKSVRAYFCVHIRFFGKCLESLKPSTAEQ